MVALAPQRKRARRRRGSGAIGLDLDRWQSIAVGTGQLGLADS
jgi:hypothetical protein